MSVMRCPHCSRQWDSDFEDREGELCGNCEDDEQNLLEQHMAAQAADDEATGACRP